MGLWLTECSDTVAATLVYLFYRLARHPEKTQILLAELQSIDSIYDFQTLKRLPYLNGCVYEALRLHPAVPSGGLRDTPKNGVQVSGRSLPGEVTICVPQYTMGRC